MTQYNIILVGEENLSRSIIAEAVLKKILEERDVSNVNVVSRGRVVLFSEPISPKAAAVLYEHSCPSASKRSTELTQEDMEQADFVLAMSQEDVDHIKEEFEGNTVCMSLATFIDMEEDIPKMMEDTKEAYEELYQRTRQAMEAVADRLITEMLIP